MDARPAAMAEGNLAKTPFAHVLLYVRERRLTGTLAVQAPADAPHELDGESLLRLDRGALAQVRLPRVLDPLGFVMRELGLISDEALHESLARLAAGEGLQGDILRALGACDAAAVERGLRTQVRRKALRLFALPEAPYQYFADVDLLAGFGRERVAEDVLAVVWHGVRSNPEQRAIEGVLARIGSNHVRLRASEATELRAFEFDRAEEGVLDLLRCEPAPVDQLLRAGCDPRIARALVYLLVATKQVEIVPPGTPAVRVTGSSSMPPQAAAAGSDPGAGGAPRPALLPRSSAPILPARRTSPALPPRPSAPTAAASAPTTPATPATPTTTAMAPTLPARRSQTGLPRRRSEPGVPRRSSAPTPDVPPELAGKLAEARARLTAMEDETYFQMLDVPLSADDDAVRTAFLQAAAVWHPDRTPGNSPAIRDVYQSVFALLNEAQSTLSDPKTRGRYLRTIQDGGGTPRAQRQVAQLVEAATDVQKAEICIRVRDYAEAERLCRKAIQVTPDDSNTLFVLATALMEKQPESVPAEVVSLLTRAVEIAPRNDRAHVLLGTVYRRHGNLVAATRHFRQAAEINPKNVDAAREVRLAEMRGRGSAGAPPNASTPNPPEGPKGGGFLSKLLKR
jgi:tetratricopeptide (TPR) repeat protein